VLMIFFFVSLKCTDLYIECLHNT